MAPHVRAQGTPSLGPPPILQPGANTPPLRRCKRRKKVMATEGEGVGVERSVDLVSEGCVGRIGGEGDARERGGGEGDMGRIGGEGDARGGAVMAGGAAVVAMAAARI